MNTHALIQQILDFSLDKTSSQEDFLQFRDLVDQFENSLGPVPFMQEQYQIFYQLNVFSWYQKIWNEVLRFITNYLDFWPIGRLVGMLWNHRQYTHCNGSIDHVKSIILYQPWSNPRVLEETVRSIAIFKDHLLEYRNRK